MNGSYLHNHILLDPFEAYFQSVEAAVTREFYTGPSTYSGFIDLLIECHNHRIAIEAETSSARVINDVNKAKAVNASLLVIVTPNAQIAQSCHEKLIRNGHKTIKNPEVWVLSLGLALQRLTNKFPKIPTSFNTPETKKPRNKESKSS